MNGMTNRFNGPSSADDSMVTFACTPEPELNTAEKIIESVKVPSLPEAAMRLLTLCQDEQVGAGEIVQIIELDTALSARLLRVANSSYFGQSGKVNTVTRAAVLLGNEYISAVALGFYLSSGWKNSGEDGLNMKEFWHDSVLRACLARQLAKSSAALCCEEAFLVGILQNIGALVLAGHFGDDYLEFLAGEYEETSQRHDAEREQFGTDRAELAGTLAKRWGFPDSLVTTLERQYTQPPFMRTQDHATALWQIAYFCTAIPFAPDKQTAKIDVTMRHLAISALTLSFEGLSNAFTAAVDQFNDLRAVFADVMSDQHDAATLMRQAVEMIGEIDTDAIEEILHS